MSETIQRLIVRARRLPGCSVFSPAGLPVLDPDRALPEDVQAFYELCGGMLLFAKSLYPLRIVPPAEFVLANPVIVGDIYEEDLSSSWYIVADDLQGDYVTIDLHPARLGRCYDSFHEVHAVPGYCPIIATSFTTFLYRMIRHAGAYWYWLQDDFESLGDAYDSSRREEGEAR